VTKFRTFTGLAEFAHPDFIKLVHNALNYSDIICNKTWFKITCIWTFYT